MKNGHGLCAVGLVESQGFFVAEGSVRKVEIVLI